MIINRIWAMPNKWTFKIKPITDLLARYVKDGKGWADPFAGQTSPAEYTNDLNPVSCAKFHIEAVEFCKLLRHNLTGCLIDPPYSYRQVTECYRIAGRKASAMDTSSNFRSRVANEIAPKIRLGGISISFGWNTEGLGKGRGFEIIEILLVAHGSSHNDTLVTVEKKIKM